MNYFDNIIYEQEQGLIDVAMSQMEYLYKEYCLLDYGIYEESTRQIEMKNSNNTEPSQSDDTDQNSQLSKQDESSSKKQSIGSKIIQTMKKIWQQICTWVRKIIEKVTSRKTKQDLNKVCSLKESQLDQLSNAFRQAAEKHKSSNKSQHVQEFGDVGFANMKDVSKFVDIDQYEARMQELRNNPLKQQVLGHGATLASFAMASFPINPIVSAAATTIFTGYSVYSLLCTLENIVKYLKLAANKRSIYGYIPSPEAIKDAVKELNEKLKRISIIMPGAPKRIVAYRADSVLKEIKVHDSKYHPVFRQCQYFYEKEIQGSKIMSKKLEHESMDLKGQKLKRSDAKTYCECINFLRGMDLPMERLLKEFNKNAELVNQTLSSNAMLKRTKNDPLLGELLRTSKDALSMIKYFHAFSIIGSDTVKLLSIAISGSKHSEDETKEEGD